MLASAQSVARNCSRRHDLAIDVSACIKVQYTYNLECQKNHNFTTSNLSVKLQLAQMLGMASLSLRDWFKPFSDEPLRIAHPYML